MLVVDTHPLLPTGASVRAALEKLSDRLGKAGVTVARESPLLPDFAEAARLYMRLLLPAFSASWPLEQYDQVKAAAAALPPDDNSLTAERVRSAVLSHRDWMAANSARAGLRERWRRLFVEWDAVICPTMPTPPYPHDHSMPDYARRIDIDGKEYPYQDQLVWPGSRHGPGPAGDGGADRPLRHRPADRGADRRPLSRGPHDDRLCRADGAGVRRIRAAAGLRRVSLAKRAPAGLLAAKSCGSLP